MKKIFFLLTVVIGLAAFQSQAATLTWVSTPNNAMASASNNEEIFGNYDNKVPIGSINDDWVFNIDGSEQIELNVGEFLNRDFDIIVTLDGKVLDFSAAGNIGSWDFLGNVVAGNHIINIVGIVLTSAELDIRVAGIEGSEVPVPAAIWLFGSAILGLTGFSNRRKMVA